MKKLFYTFNLSEQFLWEFPHFKNRRIHNRRLRFYSKSVFTQEFLQTSQKTFYLQKYDFMDCRRNLALQLSKLRTSFLIVNRWIKILSFWSFVLFCTFFSFSISAEIQWEKSVQTAFEKAKSSGKPIFIDVYADWCGYCKTLKTEIYPKKEVQLELSKFVTLSLDGDKFPNLKRKYGIKGYPSILFLDRNGSLIDKITGMPDSKMILKSLKNAYVRRNLENEYLENLTKDPQGIQTNFQAGVYYFEAKEYSKAIQFFQKAIDSNDSKNPEKKHDALFNLGISYLEIGNFKLAITTFNSYLSKYPNGDLVSVLFFRANAFEELNLKEEAKADYKKVLELTLDPDEKQDLQTRIDSLN
ncbi:thioredoxin family protein [Leptospira noguchii]|uniref:Thioredoxin family protein n=1 Tax=Leptospira noguchii TaxID=28182 RepID=A0A9Q8RQ03_9LEPT|nr:tetratricopeptide repeat protein [Leptospira noguchii]TQE83489.1 tetratricopeptide repeat protein [Leptospira noguchii]UOG54869.1 thioredoxin family protein [Leptospira noguchii]UOG58446.1 thioredoxin family protein [Leptospira noguchii]